LSRGSSVTIDAMCDNSDRAPSNLERVWVFLNEPSLPKNAGFRQTSHRL
jgi:hypothetical protein